MVYVGEGVSVRQCHTSSPLRVGAVGDPLQLVEDEMRDDKLVIEETRIDDVGDSAVDDGARIDYDLRLATLAPTRGRALATEQPRRLSGGYEILAFGHRESDHAEPKADRNADRQVCSEWTGQSRQGKTEQKGYQQTEQQPHD